MRVLLTNDDGFEERGLRALYDSVASEHEVFIVAPDRERSVCGHSATFDEPLCVRWHDDDIMGTVLAVNGTPVDCVRLAVAELIKPPVDLVLSGINRGANISVVDVSQSGTVAGAREAAFCGIRGIAVSQMYRHDEQIDWETAAELTRRMIPRLLEYQAPLSTVWNLNLPALRPGEKPGVQIVPLSTDQIPLKYHADADPANKERRFDYSGFYESRSIRAGTDVAAVFGGDISVTPLNCDATDHSLREQLPPIDL